MMKAILLVSLFVCVYFLTGNNIYASPIGQESYVTIINPVRGRIFWKNDHAMSDQIEIIKEKNLPATWLIQYAVLEDRQTVETLKSLPQNQEIGLFLEIDRSVADDALVPYLIGEGDWARPDKLLLSGYSPKERKWIIDTIFAKFKNVFGYYPVTVGAWYIDAVSLAYMVDKYGIVANLTVADQYQTDKYGLWGQPWGTPYYPSKFNPLVPAQTKENKLGIVTLQWAQRDPVRGFGLNIADSTYSVQANDYVAHHKLTTDYFRHLAHIYLFSENPINQLTVGLEVGQEGVTYKEEFKRQIEFLSDLKRENKIDSVTVSEFVKRFKGIYPDSSPNYFINGKDIDRLDFEASWYSSPFYRIGLIKDKDNFKIMDFRVYDENLLFTDSFGRDTNHTLQRIIPPVIDGLILKNSKVLFQDIKTQEITRETEGITVTLADTNDRKYKMVLKKNQIFIDNKQIIQIVDKLTLKQKIRNKLVWFLMSYQLVKDHQWRVSIRFSHINNADYLGLWTAPNQLIGVRTSTPYIGIFNIPFQVLVRFKTLPELDWFRMISRYFINYLNHSTIKNVANI